MKTEQTNAPKAIFTVLAMIAAMVLSKGLGMVRSMCMTYAYGTGWQANAFSAASRIPLSFFDLLFSAAILGCFIPVYNSFQNDDSIPVDKREDEANRFACIFLNFILLLTGLLSVLGILFAKQIIAVIAPGLPEKTAELAVSLLRIMFPMTLFTGSAYTLVGIMQSKDHFLLPSLISAISNLGVILYFLFLNNRLGERSIYGLAVAYLISWTLQLLTLAVPLAGMRFPYRLLLDLKNPALRRAIRMTPPIMIGSWLAPIGMLSGAHFAAQLEIAGAMSIFDYSVNIYTIITGILTYGICNFIFPRLSRQSAAGDESAFASTARIGILSALAIVLPVMAAVLVLAGEGTAIIYQRGAFTAEDTRETALALRCIALGMPAFCLTEIISRIMFAKTSVYVPMAASLGGVCVNLLSSFLLVRTTADTLHVGSVSLANSLGQTVCAGILIFAMFRKIHGILSKEFLFSLLRLAVLTLLSAGIMFLTAHLLSNDPTTAGLNKNFLTCIIVFFPAAAIYLIGLRISKIQFQ